MIYGYGLSHDSYNNENPVEILTFRCIFTEKTEKNKPILMLIHGGGFRGGDKTSMRQYVEFSKYFASGGGQCLILTIRLLKDYGSVPDKWKEMVDKEDY